MTSLNRRRVVPALALAATAVAATAPGASATPVNPAGVPAVPVTGGKSTITLASSFTRTLSRAGIRVGGSGARGVNLDFRVADGVLADPSLDTGTIDHLGTITVRSHRHRLTWSDPTLLLSRSSRSINVVSAGRRVTALTIQGGAVKRDGFDTGTANAGLKLTNAGARIISRVMHVRVRGGAAVGVLNSAQTVGGLMVKTGTTTLALSSQAQQRLAAGGIVPSAQAPATLTAAPPSVTLPVKPGTVLLFGRSGLLVGNVRHGGGVTFTQPSTGRSVVTTNYTVDTTLAAPRLLVAIAPGTTLAPLGDLSLTANPVVDRTQRTVSLTGVTTTLDPVAASYLQSQFPTAGFQAGDLLGTGSQQIQAQ